MIKVLIAELSDVEQKGTDPLSFIRSQLHKGFLLSDYLSDRNHLISSVGYLMCQRLLMEQGVTDEHLFTLRKGAYGKWELPKATVDFNVSHSGDKVVAALTDQGKIGIDVEEVKSIEWQNYKACFESREWITLSQSLHPQQTFFELWTRKESLSKAYGFGLQLPFDQIIVNDLTGYAGDGSRAGYFYPLQIPEYCACVCATEPQQMQVQSFSMYGVPGK